MLVIVIRHKAFWMLQPEADSNVYAKMLKCA